MQLSVLVVELLSCLSTLNATAMGGGEECGANDSCHVKTLVIEYSKMLYSTNNVQLLGQL